ncbi:unnamed protein product [Protopolystoma xenopodis]|uniref:Uncharacterized protein n=1 Tax=Protopolystoma xenopodis TaxID=117903 RepID=A0A3S5AY14_9PLAT|nr:unnamed protein product [Protopolystoma xenopodis]
MRHRFLVGHLALPPVHSHTGIHLARGFSFFDHPIHTNSSQTNAVPSTISAASINPVPGSVAISSNKFSHISATGDGMTCSIGFNSPKQGATTRKPTENISELRLQHEKTPSALTLSSLASNLLLKGGGLQLAICSISLNNGPYMDFMNNSDPDMGGEEINGPTQPAGACLLAALTNLSTKPLSVAPISLSNRQATVALPSDLTPDTALLTVLPAAGATAVAVATTVAAVTRATCPQGTQDAELPGQLGDPSNLSSTVPMVAGLGWAQETAYCPKGQLVVHLHEHKPGMLSLAVHPSGRLLASCSSGDGLVKLWDCGHQLNQQYQSAVHLLGKTHLPACGHIASGSLFGATSILRQAGLSEGTNIFGFSPNASIGYGGASIAWSRLITSLKTDYSVPLHARQLLRQYQPHQNSTQHQPTGPRATEMASNRFLPTRAARTYAANFENCHFQGGELKGCRVGLKINHLLMLLHIDKFIKNGERARRITWES